MPWLISWFTKEADKQKQRMKGITDKTKDYVISKCEKDTNFVVRMVCEEETKRYMNQDV